MSTKINISRLKIEFIAGVGHGGTQAQKREMRGKMRRLCILLPMLALLSAAAHADGLNITWREARVVKLAKPAVSVVVGDPTVADVTLDDPTTVIVFGKTPGETNLIVLSASQELLLDWQLVVNPITQGHVSIMASGDKGPVETLYSCGGERCTRVLSPTDVQFQSSSVSTTSSNATQTSNVNQTSSANQSSNGIPTNQGGGQGGGNVEQQ